MNQVDIQTNHDSRRRELRITDIPLQVEIRKSRSFNLGKFHLCSFIDINLGGIGIYSDKLALRVLDRVNMLVHYHHRSYFVRGIIGYRQEVNGGVQYGVIFVEVPGELDLLVTKAMDSEQTPGNDSSLHIDTYTDTNLVPGGQRRVDVRRTTPLVSIKVRKSGSLSSSRYYEASMVDISRRGIGFVSDSFVCELMSEVELVLGYGGHSHVARGVVCYNGKIAEGYCYGVEFGQVAPGLLALLNQNRGCE